MKRHCFLAWSGTIVLSFTMICAFRLASGADSPLVVNLWPGQAPDESGNIGPERVRMSPKLDRRQVEVTEPTRLITGVTKPTLTVYRPPREKETGTAMLICPGGGYWDLYWELEGEEVAAWLNSIGVTGIILKYRVPRRPDEPKGQPARRPLQDAQRAVSLVRSKAGEWDLRRIGMVGFSAGGHLAMATATSFKNRTYEPVDAIDEISCRPDFAIAVYSGYLKAKDKDELAPAVQVPAGTPPVFLAHGGEDIISPPEHSVFMYLALKRAGVPAELHIYAGAAHDFGVRPSDQPCSTWTDACLQWLRHQEFLKSPDPLPLKEGSTVELGGGRVTITKLDALPYVESEYTRQFRFDSADNPKLQELRQRYQLDKVVAPGRDEFDRQVRLLDWAHSRFKKFGRPTAEARGALEILKGIEDGEAFFCTQYAQLFVSAAASMGWIDRPLALRRHQDKPGGGSTEHSTTEIWSNQYRKWVMMDPTAKMYLEKDGIPLSAYEIRREWFYRDGRDLVFVIGKERKKYRKPELPIFLGYFDGFGDLTVSVDELDKYGFTAYIPNTDLMDTGFDYGRMVIVKDQLCDGTRWHTRKIPANPEADLYFPIGQAAVSLLPEQDKIRVTLRTLTPNFKEHQVRKDGGTWTPCGHTLLWDLHPGVNRLEAIAVNAFGVDGPISTVEAIREN